MRIGIEVLGTQSASRFRGIGRYIHEFVGKLLQVDRRNEYVVYGEEAALRDFLPNVPSRVPFRWVAPDAAAGDRDMTDALRRVLTANDDRLDLFLVTSPLELRQDCLIPTPPVGPMKMGTILYDLIPLIYQDHYYKTWPGADFVRRYQRALHRLKTYDVFLAISEATKVDAVKYMGIAPEKVFNVQAASDAEVWNRGEACETRSERAALASLGVKGRYVYSVGAMEYRKNLWGMLDAFAHLPEATRAGLQLVMTYAMSPEEAGAVHRYAAKAGILDKLVLTPRLTDAELATLYRRCDLFVFPSMYEGFGLPVLEALRCGAAVVTGRNSSLIEVVGDAGLLVDVRDSHEIGEAIRKILETPQLARDLRRKAGTQAERFSWEISARLAIEAFDAAAKPAKPAVAAFRPAGRRRPRRSRIAFFTPLPPKLSGISDYSERLIEELRNDYLIDVYHDAGYEPLAKLRTHDVGCHDYRLFPRHAKTVPYASLIYQMGNSSLHKYIYDLMKSRPGIVTLHDFNLANFRFWDAMTHGGGIEQFRGEVEDFDPRLAKRMGEAFDEWRQDPPRFVERCMEFGAYLNQGVFRSATSVVVHSPWCVRQAETVHGPLAAKMKVVRYGATVQERSADERAALRVRYGLPTDAFVVGNFGIISRSKMNEESIRAFAAVARERKDALFVFVGPECDDGLSRRAVEQAGLADRVRFMGPRGADEFVEIVATADLGLNLRRPPTNGETSSSLLDLLRQGIPTIVTEVGTFADFPASTVAKVDWESQGQEGLTRATLELSRDEAKRRTLGEAALRFVAENHSWAAAARVYRDLIEGSSATNAGPATAKPESILRGPHFRRPESSSRPPIEGRIG